MQMWRLVRQGILAGIWAYAAATWASIGHHLVGLPDVVSLAAVGAALGSATWSFMRSSRPRQGARHPYKGSLFLK